eukprot:4874-Karenia_brevis.AAC.1
MVAAQQRSILVARGSKTNLKDGGNEFERWWCSNSSKICAAGSKSGCCTASHRGHRKLRN